MTRTSNGNVSRCLKCGRDFSREHRTRGRCPYCATVFQAAELSALCVGIALTFR